MDDLIRRQDAIAIFARREREMFELQDTYLAGAMHGAQHLMATLPSAQKKGHWNFVGDNLFECTCCGKMYTTQQLNGLRVYDKDPYCPFFCPHCGADMRGEEDG